VVQWENGLGGFFCHSVCHSEGILPRVSFGMTNRMAKNPIVSQFSKTEKKTQIRKPHKSLYINDLCGFYNFITTMLSYPRKRPNDQIFDLERYNIF
jgi:hypothetical protein